MVSLYLKLWPVHMHARAVGVAEPLQILLRAGWCDGVFKFSVHCSITAERQQGFSVRVMISWWLFPVRLTVLSISNLWSSVRLRWRLTSNSTSLRKLSLFSSNCWHWSNTCSMFSMYSGVHLLSSSRAFSYFSLAWVLKHTQWCYAISHRFNDTFIVHMLLFFSSVVKCEPY